MIKKMTKEDSDILYDADPNCVHVYDGRWSGIGCMNCKGWFCY